MYRRSLFAVEDIRAGERLTAANVRIIRPGHGLAPRHLDDVLERMPRRTLRAALPSQWEMIADC